MNRLHVNTRSVVMLVVLIPLLALFVFVSLRSGPLAPISVTVAKVAARSISPALFGIGTVEARYTYKIGPTSTGRIKSLQVQVGDSVASGQIVGEMDPIDLDDRIHAQAAVVKRAEAQQNEAQANLEYTRAQAVRYKKLLAARTTSEEVLVAKEHEYRLATENLAAAREELSRVRAELAALQEQRNNLFLRAPAGGVISVRHADPGTTIVAGQAVVELIDSTSLWINVRFDQLHARGLIADLPAAITRRSQAADMQPGRVLRVEPVADAVTEEALAKVVFNKTPAPLPPLGELAEVTVTLPALPAKPVIPNAAIRRQNGKTGAWKIEADGLHFAPVTLGDSDLEGNVQVHAGLQADDRIVVYSTRVLNARSRIRIVDDLKGVKL